MTISRKHCGKGRNGSCWAISSFVTMFSKKQYSAAEASASVYMRERVNSFSANGNIEMFKNNTDLLKAVLFAFLISKYFKILITCKWSRPILNMKESSLRNSALKEFKTKSCHVLSYTDTNRKYTNISRPAKKQTFWPLRKESTRISLSMPRRLTRADNFRLLWIFCFRNNYSIPLSPLRRNVSARISLRGLRRLIWVDTLCRGHNVDFRGKAQIY